MHFRRARPSVADGALALTILAVGIVDVVVFGHVYAAPPFRVAIAWSIPLLAAMSVPLTMRQRKLWAAYILIQSAAIVAGHVLHLIVSYDWGYLLVAYVLLFSVGEQSNLLVTAALTHGQLASFLS